MTPHIDFIGDIHGYADKLEELLKKMGYFFHNGTWKHPERKARFVGDLIDRGTQNLRVIKIVRNMLEAGSAECVMGNHEFNAISFYHGLRARNEKNRKQHETFLNEVGCDSLEHKSVIEWMFSLPLFIEDEQTRLIHACWHEPSIQTIIEKSQNHNAFCIESFISSGDFGNELISQAVDTLLKGPEFPLPNTITVRDKHGHQRNNARLKWWNTNGNKWEDFAMINGLDYEGGFPDEAFPQEHIIGVDTKKLTFFGHYWMEGTPTPLGRKTACLDFSVANKGKLAAYRWSGEHDLIEKNFIFV